ncbi:hypothetical protein [Paracidobacterium acidisoli]|uniref:hypothetical protein n=1 Tax=Paracidobacterium acidisoli TaxID=2303751 RepID=UPI0011C149FA|nr:hypothetical protein [Paracidobacterium acidisoli]MBT9332000.1 hypothetical protein [Paracidobacterium acidisoli]
MALTWEHFIWRRRSRLQIGLPLHGPSLATLVKLIAKNHTFIADIDMERLAATVTLKPGVTTHEPAVVIIVIRTRGKRHEKQLLQTLSSFGYVCKPIHPARL